MISDLILDKEKYKDYSFPDDKAKLTNLNRINIFIGQNSSGKSRFLRRLFADKEFRFDLLNIKKRLHELIKQRSPEIDEKFETLQIKDWTRLGIHFSNILNQKLYFDFKSVKEDVLAVKSLIDATLENNYVKEPENIYLNSKPDYPDDFIKYIGNIGKEISDILGNSFSKNDYLPERIYIPILRGLRAVQVTDKNFNLSHDNYRERTIKDYFPELIEKNEIFTGLTMYEDTKELLLGDREGREKIKGFENFLSTNFFNNKEVTIRPHPKKEVITLTIGHENDRPIHDLGDGIQSLIILLYPLFYNQGKNLLVFMEEPENSMHPGLQRLFLETLMREEFKSYQYFITTHSNHFLDISLDMDYISIYSFQKTEDENRKNSYLKIENSSNADIRVLDLIGARNASVFLSNCTIWVEGITDRLYLRKYLEVYQEKIKSSYKEDSNFSFIEYGGGNIVHWAFTDDIESEKIKASRISSKFLLIADKDNYELQPESAKTKRLKELADKLGTKFRPVDGREIENTLSEKILIETIKELEKKNADKIEYDKEKIKAENYTLEKIGEFIDNEFKHLKRKYAADSGTIRNKVEFCKTAVSLIKDYDDLSTEGKALAEYIYNFIKASNS